MNSLRQIIESSPSVRHLGLDQNFSSQTPQPLAPAPWDWSSVRRVLVIRLRSIGDAVLSTPSLRALRRFVPHAQIHFLLEDWIVPLFCGSDLFDELISMAPHGNAARARVARELRRREYDVVYNLHGGTTATFLTRATGAKHRVGFSHYQYARLHNHLAPPPAEIWKRAPLHSAEQQLALVGWTGVPVTDRPATEVPIRESSVRSITSKLEKIRIEPQQPLALIHPAASLATKQWATENFARVAESVSARGLRPVVIVQRSERPVLDLLNRESSVPIAGLDDLSLPEVTALAARARLFVGNDSGIAHIAAAAGAPCVVVFGSSNVAHWRPWTTALNEVVREELPCQPCHGYFCAEFDEPECIKRVPAQRVIAAVDRLLDQTE